jgi:hypothetical protein
MKLRKDIRNFVFLFAVHPVSMTPAINYRRCHCYQRLIIAGVIVTGYLALGFLSIQ